MITPEGSDVSLGDGEPRRADVPRSGCFVSTQWGVVLAAGGPDPELQAAALEHLCRTYWGPLYAYVRRRGNGPEDAQDLVQEFFARLLEKRWLEGIERNGSRFRSFLLHALNGFLANQYDRVRAAKRGGGLERVPLDAEEAERGYSQALVTESTAEQVYDRRWALTVLEMAMNRVKQEVAGTGKERPFEILSPFLSREPEPGEYAAAASALGISAGAVGVSVHRLRQRYRECVRSVVAETVSDPAQVDEELTALLAVLRQG